MICAIHEIPSPINTKHTGATARQVGGRSVKRHPMFHLILQEIEPKSETQISWTNNPLTVISVALCWNVSSFRTMFSMKMFRILRCSCSNITATKSSHFSMRQRYCNRWSSLKIAKMWLPPGNVSVIPERDGWQICNGFFFVFGQNWLIFSICFCYLQIDDLNQASINCIENVVFPLEHMILKSPLASHSIVHVNLFILNEFRQFSPFSTCWNEPVKALSSMFFVLNWIRETWIKLKQHQPRRRHRHRRHHHHLIVLQFTQNL